MTVTPRKNLASACVNSPLSMVYKSRFAEDKNNTKNDISLRLSVFLSANESKDPGGDLFRMVDEQLAMIHFPEDLHMSVRA